MAVLWFDGLLLQADVAGVYFLPEEDIDELREAAAVNAFRCLRLSLQGCAEGDDLRGRLARALHLPAHADADWGVFADALGEHRGHDARGLVLLLEASERLRRPAGAAFRAAMESLQEASRRWRQRGLPLWTFVALPESEFEALD